MPDITSNPLSFKYDLNTKESFLENLNANNSDVDPNKLLNTVIFNNSRSNIPPNVSVDNKERIKDLQAYDTDDYIESDDLSKITNLQEQLLANKKFVDEQLASIEGLTANYDKFSKSVFEMKLEFIRERSRIVESLMKILTEKNKKFVDIDGAKDITEILGR